MTTILTKKKDTAGAPAPGDLTNAAGGAELAVNTATKRLYSKDSGGTVIEIGTFPSSMTVEGDLTVLGNITDSAFAPTLTVSGNMDDGVNDFAVTVTPAIQSNVTTSANMFNTAPTTQATAFTLVSLRHYFAQQGTFGAGSTVTDQYGFITSSGLTGATFNYGFHGNIAATASVAITSISGTGSTATVESAASHGLTNGDNVFISGTSTPGFNGGPFTVTVVDSNTFTYPSTATTASTGGFSTQTNDWNFYSNGTAPNWFGGPNVISANSAMAALRITQIGTGNALLVEDSANPDSNPFVIDSSGFTIVGYTEPVATVNFAGGAITPLFQVQGVGLSSSSASLSNWSGVAASSSSFVFNKSNSGTIGTRGVVTGSTNLGSINFAGDDGTNFIAAASIVASVDGTPGTNDMPGRLVFNTTPNGSATYQERMRIDSSGNVGIGTSAPAVEFEVSSATGSASPVPTEIRISTTTSASDYSTTLPWGRLSFYSADGSYAGPKIQASIDTIADIANGGISSMVFNTATVAGVLTECMRITSDGDVGISTITPAGGYAYNSASRILGIAGDASASTASAGVLNLDNNRATPNASDGFGVIGFTSSNSVAGQTLKAFIQGIADGSGGVTGGFGGQIQFYTKPDNSATQATNRMTIDSAGLVGIGTASPSQELQLYKDSNGTTTAEIVNPNAGSSAAARLVLSPENGAAYFAANSSTYSGAAITGGANGASLYTASGTTNGLSVGTTAGPLKFFAGSTSTERIRINATGEVGIGKIASGYELDIDAGSNNAIQTTQTGLTAIQMVSTDASGSGMNVQYFKDSASPAGGDSLVLLRFFGNDSAANQQEYARITSLILSPTNGSETGQLNFGVAITGSVTNKLIITPTAFTAAEVYNQTTASAANVFVASGGQMSRSTSSIQYKTNVEDLAELNSANIYNMRPVWYRSTCTNDNKNWSWYGLIAEEVADLDPRLVHWGYANDQYDITYIENDGQKEEVKTLKEDAVLQPEGVQYDRLTVLLIQEMKVLKAEMRELKVKVAALEAK